MENSSTKKIILGMSATLKNQVAQLAINKHAQQKEPERWEKAAKCAVKDKKYIAVIKDFRDDCGSVFEY